MLSLSISITPEAIGSIESDLAKTLYEVNPLHRVEALARGLGFSTYASMLAASKSSPGSTAVFDWKAADECLKTHGFTVPAEPFFVAIGRVAIQQLLVREAQLTTDGMGLNPLHRPLTGKREDRKEYAARFQRCREEFKGDHEVKQFLRALAFVTNIRRVETINRTLSSYRLKHNAERFSSTYPDGTRLGPDYVSNGALIAAAIHAGFQYWKHPGTTEVAFNMSRESIGTLYVETQEAEKRDKERRLAAGPGLASSKEHQPSAPL
jgi:hypothetical protein